MRPHHGRGMWWNPKLVVLFQQCFVALGVTLIFFSPPAQAAQVTATWNGGVGNWNDPTKWSGGVVPNNGVPAGTTYAVSIDGGSATVSNVSLNIGVTVDTLTISSGDTLGINNGQTLTVATASTLSNAGTIALNSAGSSTDLKIGGDVSLSGGGVVTMTNFTANRIYSSTGTARLTNVNNTISGSGNLGNNSMLLTNQGTIIANSSSGLTIDPNGATNFNSATMRADSTGTLTLNSGTFTNTGGTISANAGTVVLNSSALVTGGTVNVVGAGELRLANGASVTGGTVTNSATGTIRSQGSTNILGGAVTNLAGGQIVLDNGTTLNLSGGAGNTYNNAGKIALNSAGSSTDLRITGDVSLTGGGTVLMTNFTANRIYGVVGTERLTNVNNTISGAGNIGNNSMLLTNQGTIVANVTNGLTIDPNGATNINSATMRADSTGTLAFNSGTFNNTGGTINANTGVVIFNSSALVTAGTVKATGAGEVRLANGASVTGGTVTNSTTGTIRSQGSTNTLGGAVTNPAGGQIVLDNGTTLTLAGGAGNTYNNAGKIALNSAGSSTDLKISGDVSLTGSGTVVMTNFTANRIYGSVGTERLTNVNNTISGAGNIGNNSMLLTNQGTIVANVSNPLTIDPNGATNFNSATMRADSTGTLALNSGTFTNTGGTISANTGTVILNSSVIVTAGTVNVVGAGELRLANGASVTGGTVTNSATGTIRSQGSTNALGGTVSNPAGGQIVLDNGTTLNLSGGAGNTYNNAGKIALNSAGSSTDLRITGDVSLTGSGTVLMSNFTANRIYGVAGTERLTNVNNTISGAGNIGTNAMLLTNQGAVVANVSNPLTVDVTPAATGFTSSGTMQCDAGSTLAMGSGDVFTQTAGNTLVNGTLTLTGGMTLQLQGGTLKGSGTVGGPVNNSGGTVAPGNSPGILSTGNYTQASGATLGIEVNGATVGTGYDQLKVTGTVSLAGTLAVSLTGGFVPTGNSLLTIISNDGTADAVAGTFTGLAEGAVFTSSSTAFSISYVGGDGNDVVLKAIPLITINNVTQVEGNSGTTNFVFTVSLSAASNQAVSVKFLTANGTATTVGNDYVGLPLTTLTIPAGQTSGTVTVAVNGDTLFEANETFVVNLSAAVNALISDAQGSGTITNDDATPTITINNVSVNEGNSGTTTATFTVSLSAASGLTTTVKFATADGTATAGSDYVARALTTLTIAAGQTSGSVVVTVNGDTTIEANETFFVNLTSPVNATIADNQGQGTITNDDFAAVFINDVTMIEGNTGATDVFFTISLSTPAVFPVTVTYTTANGTAASGSDYTATTASVTFNVGEKSKAGAVPVLGDVAVEGNQTFLVNLTSPTNGVISDAQGVCTIVDDDAAPPIMSDEPEPVVEGPSGGSS